MTVNVFKAAKQGNDPEEYEDAFAASVERSRFAIADGATESSFACEWAELLVREFVDRPVRFRREFADWLEPLRTRWWEDVGNRQLPWFGELKAQRGAHSTFLGLLLERTTSNLSPVWRAIAVGDSCLFQMRGAAMIRSFPVEDSTEFNSTPQLFGTGASDLDVAKLGRRVRGKWRPKDVFLMMTDALSEWFLRNHEAGLLPGETIQEIVDHADPQVKFHDWMEQIRDGGQIRNDDVTLIAITAQSAEA